MTLKRKRSSPSFSSHSTTNSEDSAMDTSDIPCFYQQNKPVDAFAQKSTWSFPMYNNDSCEPHLDSRTRKRHRDNRPEEQEVYGVSRWVGAMMNMSSLADVCCYAASTIQRLYDAQRNHPDAAPIPSVQSLATPFAPAQKSTLHSFWSINQAPAVSEPTQMQLDVEMASSVRATLNCEDCDRSLRYNDALDVDEDLVRQEMACGICQRHVCDICAVLGYERLCLACASKR